MMDRGSPKGPFCEGEAVLFLDRKQREYLRRLDRRKKLSIREGQISIDDILGLEEGASVRSSVGDIFLIFRPSLAQLIPNLPRTAQVIYPKDIGLILVWADIFPGAKVVEAGVGPGALTMALLRAVGQAGQLISYEIREDFAQMARQNVANYYGPAPHWTLKLGDVALQLEETEVDRIILDLPEPWQVIDPAWRALRPGGILLGYLPTVLQVKSFVDGLKEHGGFACIETLESLLRAWHLREQSVRPQHRMVAHTGFIIVARRIAPAKIHPTPLSKNSDSKE